MRSSMRRFFKAQRDEDYSQIQYLTAKCTRLAHDKAVADREFLLSSEREKKLLNDLNAVTTQLLQQEQLNIELRRKEDQLITRIHQQQQLVLALRQRVVLLLEDGSQNAELLWQVGSELLCLQRSEVRLEGLVEELNDEAHRRAAEAESLQEELHAEAQLRKELTESLEEELHDKTIQLEELQGVTKDLNEELKNLTSAHQTEVMMLQQENERSLRKLQETAEQFEWVCQQQRYWVCCVKKFKDGLLEERDGLLQQVNTLRKEAKDLSARLWENKAMCDDCCHLQDTEGCDSRIASWDADGLHSHVDKTNTLFEKIFNVKARAPINGHQKPP